MSVVAAHLYRNGKKAKAVSLDEPIDCKGKSEFVWIGLFEPTERELEQLEKNYGLHPLAIEDALKANQLPKVDVYGDQLFVMTRTARLEHDHIAYGETAILVGKNFIITSLDYVADEDAARRNIWSGDFDMPWDWRA